MIILWALVMICAVARLIANIIFLVQDNIQEKRKTLENIEKSIETVKLKNEKDVKILLEKFYFLMNEIQRLQNENVDLKIKVEKLELNEQLRDLNKHRIGI